MNPADLQLSLDPGSAEPLYRAVKRQLTRHLAEGAWAPGRALPSETRLAEQFSVSIGTLRKAIDELVAEGAVVRRQGRGTFVSTHGANRPVFHFFHIVGRDGARATPVTRTVAFRRARAEPDEAARLRIAAGDPVYRIRNLLTLDGDAVVLDDLVLPQRLYPDLTERIFTGRDNTIYHLYQTRYGVNVLRTSERLRAVLAPSDAARLLGVKKGAPLLEIDRVAMSFDDAPVELRRSLVDTQAHDYYSDLGKTERG